MTGQELAIRLRRQAEFREEFPNKVQASLQECIQKRQVIQLKIAQCCLLMVLLDVLRLRLEGLALAAAIEQEAR